MAVTLQKRGVLPGFSLTLGFSVFYLKPCKIVKYREDSGRIEYLTDEQMHRLLETSNQDRNSFVHLYWFVHGNEKRRNPCYPLGRYRLWSKADSYTQGPRPGHEHNLFRKPSALS